MKWITLGNKQDWKEFFKAPIVVIFLGGSILFYSLSWAIPDAKVPILNKPACTCPLKFDGYSGKLGMQFKLNEFLNKQALPGDVNLSGSVNVADMREWLLLVSALKALDFNRDNVVDSTDFKELQEYIF